MAQQLLLLLGGEQLLLPQKQLEEPEPGTSMG